jgi:hypothetical protein
MIVIRSRGDVTIEVPPPSRCHLPPLLAEAGRPERGVPVRCECQFRALRSLLRPALKSRSFWSGREDQEGAISRKCPRQRSGRAPGPRRGPHPMG